MPLTSHTLFQLCALYCKSQWNDIGVPGRVQTDATCCETTWTAKNQKGHLTCVLHMPVARENPHLRLDQRDLVEDALVRFALR
jgi:hypothetical protein